MEGTTNSTTNTLGSATTTPTTDTTTTDTGAPVIGGVPTAPGTIEPENSEGKSAVQPTGTADTDGAACIEHPAASGLQRIEDFAEHLAEELKADFLAAVVWVRAELRA